MSDFIKVDLTHNLYRNKKWKEIKLNKFEKIENIKRKIYTHTGTPHDNMNLYAYDELNIENTQVFLNNDQLCLNDYNVRDNYTIYIQEMNNSSANDIIYNIDDAEKLEKLKHLKYEINEENYNKRQDTFRTFLKKLKDTKKGNITKKEHTDVLNTNVLNTNVLNTNVLNTNVLNTNVLNTNVLNTDVLNTNALNTNAQGTYNNTYDKEVYKVDTRCRIKMGDRRGVLKYIGNLKNNNELYVGIDLDEPLGNSDGMYKNQFLFECKGDKYGYIGHINSIEMGNFPPFDIMNLEEF
ncbi:tubulin-specific chaperone, putative [Plasmodium malariae]|uniref:Tubulin-specific chaperone, putative n=1 Tax=Plasmodium malariae TaxID=5858 RepID=A0A1D3JM34_PLAMA|nr:tubulin-specific chaperone, putative [Plasmodium malariae]SBT87724.1 tubulin-specific chaperone, putative [Plasmodium malariae]